MSTGRPRTAGPAIDRRARSRTEGRLLDALAQRVRGCPRALPAGRPRRGGQRARRAAGRPTCARRQRDRARHRPAPAAATRDCPAAATARRAPGAAAARPAPLPPPVPPPAAATPEVTAQPGDPLRGTWPVRSPPPRSRRWSGATAGRWGFHAWFDRIVRPATSSASIHEAAAPESAPDMMPAPATGRHLRRGPGRRRPSRSRRGRHG